MSFVYDYPLTDTPNNAVASPKLKKEIEAENSGIVTQLAANPILTVVSDISTVRLNFKAALSTSEEASLDSVIALHDGVPEPQPEAVEIKNIPKVITSRPTPEMGVSRTYAFTIDWTKPQTWYNDAIQVTNEVVGFGDGVKTQFQLAHGGPTSGEYILNLTGGLITEEQFTYAPGSPYPTGIGFGYGYSPLVTVDSVPMVEIPTYEVGKSYAAGHYWIDHINGVLNFVYPPGGGTDPGMIVMTYWYVPDDAKGTMIVRPPAGKVWTIDTVEAQFSEDVEINDSILQMKYADETPLYPVNVEYHNFGTFLDYTYGAHPMVPNIAGDRGMPSKTIILRWEFAVTMRLHDTNKDNIKMWLKHGIPMGGTRATITWYAAEEDDV